MQISYYSDFINNTGINKLSELINDDFFESQFEFTNIINAEYVPDMINIFIIEDLPKYFENSEYSEINNHFTTKMSHSANISMKKYFGIVMEAKLF